MGSGAATRNVGVALIAGMSLLAACTSIGSGTVPEASAETESETETATETESDVETLRDDLAQCLAADPSDDMATITVWMHLGVSDAEIGAVDQALAGAADVSEYTFVDADETLTQFKEYFADNPELIELVDPAELPLSFEAVVEPGDQAGALAFDIEQLPPVESTEVHAPPVNCHDELGALSRYCEDVAADDRLMAIWLEPGIHDEQVEAIRDLLVEHRMVDDFSYVDPELTEAEWQEFAADDPELLALVDADDLPTRFEITTVPLTPAERDSLDAELAASSPAITDVEPALTRAECLAGSAET